MKVLLRNVHTGCYYAGNGHWAVNDGAAQRWDHIQDAAVVWLEDQLGDAVVVLKYEQPECELKLLVQPEWFGDRATLPSEPSRMTRSRVDA